MLPWLGLALIVLIADQFTKVLILGYYQLGDSTYVAPSSTSCGRTTPARPSPSWRRPRAGSAGCSPASAWRRVGSSLDCCAATRTRSCSRSRWPASWAARRQRGRPLLHGYVVDFLQFHWAALVLPGLQRGRQRDHGRAALPGPRRMLRCAAQALPPAA
jgi:signal peptidase II